MGFVLRCDLVAVERLKRHTAVHLGLLQC